jgi:two-component system chemotaxis response regulator CheY
LQDVCGKIQTQPANDFRNMNMKRILIVDDSPTMRRMVMASLRELASVAFDEAGTGLEAIEQLALSPVDLMVLDLNMPDMHGIEVVNFVRQHAAYRAIPIIILTTRGDDSSRAAALEAGAAAYLTKPFLPNVLSARVRELLNGSA